MPQLKYGLFFISIALALTVALISMNSWRSWIIIYPIVNSLVMSLAYINNMPSLIMGKRENGRINYVLLLINAPWLLLTWLIWLLGAIASRESRSDKISGTNVYIGEYPMFIYGYKFDFAIDLTAEFLPCRKLADREELLS